MIKFTTKRFEITSIILMHSFAAIILRTKAYDSAQCAEAPVRRASRQCSREILFYLDAAPVNRKKVYFQRRLISENAAEAASDFAHRISYWRTL